MSLSVWHPSVERETEKWPVERNEYKKHSGLDEEKKDAQFSITN
jgi:hypothetical protein